MPSKHAFPSWNKYLLATKETSKVRLHLPEVWIYWDFMRTIYIIAKHKELSVFQCVYDYNFYYQISILKVCFILRYKMYMITLTF